MCYADDSLPFSSNKRDLEKMLAEIIEAFSAVGLDVGPEKSHWTSYPSQPGSLLQCQTQQIQWEDRLLFVGTVLDFVGNDGFAIDYRLCQATKVFFKWQGVLQHRGASIRRRMELARMSFMAAPLWLAETWHPTQRQREHLDSWAARMAARACCLRKAVDETPADFWRRMHRFGRLQLSLHGGNAGVQRRQRLHRFAGHLARMASGPACVALRTRSLAWWRAFQERKILKHPRRFKVWRWESQLTQYYGERKSIFIDEDVGWMAVAQSRSKWRESGESFALSDS